MILLVISHQRHSVLMHHNAIFILRTESYKTIAMHCRQKTICISASFPPFFMIPIVFNSQEAHLSNGIRTRKNGYVLAEIWSAQAESKKHCNSFVRHCITSITYLLVLLQLYLQQGKHLEKGIKMSIYVCFRDYIICLHNADKGLGSMYPVP